MCEKVEDRPDEFENSPEDDPGAKGNRLDIGEFVTTFRKIKKLTEPISSLRDGVLYITRWSSPKTSFLCLAAGCWMCLRFPAYMLLAPLIYISFVLVISGIKKIGAKRVAQTWNCYANVAKKGETSKMELKQAAVNKAHEDLREFINILILIQLLSDKACGHIENIYRLFKWDSPMETIKWFSILVVGFIFMWFIPLQYLAALYVMLVFTTNAGFMKVFRETVHSVCELFMLPSLKQIFETWHWLRRRSSTALSFHGTTTEAEKEDEWFDAENEISSDTASEDDEGSGFGESALSKNRRPRLFTVDYKGMVSQLADYRRRKKKLKFGNCASCNMSFSGLLKKRQYCRHCGESFCSRCCSQRVKRAVFGATAPAAYEETVLVCKSCYDLLTNTGGEASEFW